MSDMWALWKRPFEKIARYFQEAEVRFSRAMMWKESLAVRWCLTDIRFSGQLPPREAIQLLTQLVKELPGVEMGYEVPHILLDMAYFHRRAGDRKQANILAERAYRETEVWGEFAYMGFAARRLATWAVEDGLLARADRWYTKRVELQERLEGSKVDPWYSPDRLEDQLPDWFLVRLPGTDSLRKEISSGALAGALSDLGDVALKRGQLRKAWRCYVRSEELRASGSNWPAPASTRARRPMC